MVTDEIFDSMARAGDFNNMLQILKIYSRVTEYWYIDDYKFKATSTIGDNN